MTLLGGTIGALLSILLFRHKIKKISFMIKFVIVIALQCLLFYFSKYYFQII